MSEPDYKAIAVKLRDALSDAVEHLDYCGYGDKWERECADHAKLPEKLTRVLDETKELENA